MSSKRKYVLAIVAASAVAVATPAPAAGAGEEELRQEYNAVGVFMQGGRPETLQIVVTRWSTAEERSQLVNTLANEGQEKTLALLRQQEETGFVRLRSGQSIQGKPSVRLRYAYEFQQKDGKRLVVLVTERPMGMGESMMTSNATGANVSGITMELQTEDGKEKGTGVVYRAVKLGFDREKKKIALEGITKQPVRLTEINRVK